MIKKKNLHLIISSIIITIVSLTYGLFSGNILPKMFDFNVGSIDLMNVFRATMGLYLGMVALWIIGILKSSYWRFATLSNVLFMSGLALGRIIGLLVDGIPSTFFCVGLALELVLAIWGMRNLKLYRQVMIGYKEKQE